MKRAFWLLMVVLVAGLGCAESAVGPDNNGEGNNGAEGCVDVDGDGFDGRTSDCVSGQDCNDKNPNVNPSATEIPNDAIDNDCKDGDAFEDNSDCADADNDNFLDEACGGRDCDDANPDIKPRGVEICGNTIDEDCDGSDLECNESCIDTDADGFGAAGSTGCAGGDELDCDDSDATVFPGQNEVCNTKDDNCDDAIDECALQGQVCAGDSCQGGAGAQCENDDDCGGSKLTCDSSTDPKLCKVTEGGNCGDATDCVQGLACENGMCSGNFCASANCTGEYDECDRDAGRCVECPHWDPSPTVQDAACSGLEQCTPGGFCAANYDITDSDTLGGTSNDLLQVSKALAACWNSKKPAGDKDMCFAMWVFSAVSSNVTEDELKDAYKDGLFDAYLTTDEDDALDDIWGIGLFNLKEINWEEDLVPGTAKEICIWYQPGGLFGEAVVVDKCENFSP